MNPLTRRFLKSLGPTELIDAIFASLPDALFFVKDRQGRFIKANGNFLEHFSVKSEDDLIGKDDFAFSEHRTAEAFRRDDEAVYQGFKQINKAEIIGGKSGGLKWFRTTKLPLHDAEGQCVGLIGITRDLGRANSSLTPYLVLEPVIRHILAHYAEPLRTQDLARIAKLTLVQFTRQFKREFKMPPMHYVVMVRLNAACQLLVSSLKPISEIAFETGFYDHSFFTKQFIRYKGMSPTTYRKAFSEGHAHAVMPYHV
jgi:AraC-like DNA-binding protein